MTVEELIELLQKEHPKTQVFLSFRRYTPTRLVTTATKPVNYPIARVLTSSLDTGVFLMADQEGKYQ